MSFCKPSPSLPRRRRTEVLQAASVHVQKPAARLPITSCAAGRGRLRPTASLSSKPSSVGLSIQQITEPGATPPSANAIVDGEPPPLSCPSFANAWLYQNE